MHAVRVFKFYLVAVGLVVTASAAWLTVDLLTRSLGRTGLAIFVGALIQLAIVTIVYGVYAWTR